MWAFMRGTSLRFGAIFSIVPMVGLLGNVVSSLDAVDSHRGLRYNYYLS